VTERERKRLSDQIRACIESSDLSRYELAKRTGVTQASLSRFMSGQTALSVDSIEKLAPIFGLELVLKKKR
jgi:transcriptional regulator with XRE-family HTH domain